MSLMSYLPFCILNRGVIVYFEGNNTNGYSRDLSHWFIIIQALTESFIPYQTAVHKLSLVDIAASCLETHRFYIVLPCGVNS